MIVLELPLVVLPGDERGLCSQFPLTDNLSLGSRVFELPLSTAIDAEDGRGTTLKTVSANAGVVKILKRSGLLATSE